MAISMHEALDIIINEVKEECFEIIPIESASHRICSKDLYAQYDLPKFNNSAMDGYAILLEDQGKEVKVVDTIFAGDNNQTILQQGQAIKIMTGARVPKNTTAVVPKEDIVKLSDELIKLPNDLTKDQHIRFIGEDIKQQELLLSKGEEINFSKVTLLSSQGISHVEVFKKPKIVVFSSGEELKLHYEKIEEYQIYNSNTPTFITRCQELGCDVHFIGQAHDSIESIQDSIKNALDADLIITSGGVSVGDADFTREAFSGLGFETLFDGIIIKPGKPTIFGKINKTFILNLPGNPLASALIFELFGKVIIQKLIGSKLYHHNYINSTLGHDLENNKGRVTIIPGYFNGQSFTPSNKRGPGMVSTLSNCNSMIILDEEVSNLKASTDVKVLPINWKFFTEEKKDFLTTY